MRAIFILHRKGVVLRDTCDYPTTSNAYFTMVSEPKLSDDMKEKIFFKNFLRFRHKKHTNKLIYLLVFLMFNLFAIEK